MKLNLIDWVAYSLTVIGGLNWGLVGLFESNLVDEIFGVDSSASRIIYTLVGLSALYLLFMVAKFMSVHMDDRKYVD